ncbi:MAG: hypothetical protein ITG02_01190 [Patulibacter sp.]|nr:hypothetical protein [Patulibacter sp.]
MTELILRTDGPRSWHPEVIVEAARQAVHHVEPVLRAAAREQADRTRTLIHSRSGELARSVRGQVRRRRRGYVLRVGSFGRGNFTVRNGGARRQESGYQLFHGYFVEHGTGEQGPLARRIPDDRRGLVPTRGGRRRPTGAGQAPQRPFSRARDAYDRGPSHQLDRMVHDLVDREIVTAVRRASR